MWKQKLPPKPHKTKLRMEQKKSLQPPNDERTRKPSWWNTALIGLICFTAGLFIGGNFAGRTALQRPQPASINGLPPGHPPIDAAGMPNPSAQSSDVAAADPNFDDPAVRAEIERTNNPAELIAIGNREFDAVPRRSALAAAAYEKALKLQPNNPDVLTDLGITYRDMGRYEDAVRAFRTAAKLDPKHANSRYNTGVVLLHDLNDVKGAIAAWEEYLKVAPNGEHAEEVKRSIAELKRQTANQ